MEKQGEGPLKTHIEVLLIEPDAVMAGRYAMELERFNTRVHIARTPLEAMQCVAKKKLQGVFVTIDPTSGVNTEELMRSVRGSPSNAHVPIVALFSSDELLPLARACRAGATHLLLKPISRPHLERLMHALHPTMVAQRRKYQRVPMSFPVLCRRGDTRTVAASVNLSASGMLLSSPPDLPPEATFEVTFPFDEHVEDPFILEAHVARVGAEDTLAVSFANNPTDELDRLRLWVEMSLNAGEEHGDN